MLLDQEDHGRMQDFVEALLLHEGALGEVFSIDTAMSKLIGAKERNGLLP